MIYAVLAMMGISLILTATGYYIIALVILAVSNVLLILTGIKGKKKKEGRTEKKYEGFVITTDALKNHRIEALNESGVLTGKFMISKTLLDGLIKDFNRSKLTKDHAFENIEYLKRKNQLLEINVEDNISAYFKYAYEHNQTLLYSGEKAALNLLKIFKAKSINLGVLLSRNMDYTPGDKITYIVTGHNKGEIEGKTLGGADVFIKGSHQKYGQIYSGIVKNVLNVKGKTRLIAEGDNET